MFRGIVVPTILAALAAAVWAENTTAFPGADEFGIAALELERALATYDTDMEKTAMYLGRVNGNLSETARRFKYTEGSPQSEFILRTQERLRPIEETVYERLWRRTTAVPEEIEREKAIMNRVIGELYAMARGDPLIRPEISSDYEELRAEAARLDEEAEAVQAENRRLEERAMKVKKVMDFWKSIIGEDMASVQTWGVPREY